MILISVNIKNFRSIENVTFNIAPVDEGYTFSLIGINESGKSSFLSAISALKNNEDIKYPKDYPDRSSPVEITFEYALLSNEEENLKSELIALKFDEDLLSQVKVNHYLITTKYGNQSGSRRNTTDKIVFQKSKFSKYTLSASKPILKEQNQGEDLDLEKYFESYLPNYFRKLTHSIVLWKSEPKYLINEEINLVNFASNPENVSLPLINCFALAGIRREEIAQQINILSGNSAEISNLQEKLSDSVTNHINKVWVNHPVKIKFQITFPTLMFLVEDDKVKYQAKTTEQRSDGFRQFISFLLTISAESATNNLTNSLLLLDEPETHLHPQAQEYLRDELIKITKNNDNNIVIFATHSNYMIDKNHIERCYRVSKQIDNKTKFDKIELGKSTYAEVNYEVFGIAGSDYHNELYGYLEAEKKLGDLPKMKKWKNKKNGETWDVSLSEYIRHSIHHPENTKNEKFTDDELRKSIEELRKLRSERNE